MCVLGSREHTCIHPEISRMAHKNEECQKLLTPSKQKVTGSCPFFQHLRVKNYDDLRSHGFETAWDLEELVGFGQKTEMCPYFMSRNLLSDADIVFCPYNYLIDPKIREQMSIDLEEQIVLLDEAHNIEDFSRDAASFTLTLEQLQTTSEELDKMVKANMLPKSHQTMRHLCDILIEWIDLNKSKVTEHDFETQYKVVTGPEMETFLSSKGISMPNMPTLKDHLLTVISYATDPRSFMSVVSSGSLTVMENISLALYFLLRNGVDYRLVYMLVGQLHLCKIQCTWSLM
jgi:Fanconi anemia group J protein